jgi:hypothetical protein
MIPGMIASIRQMSADQHKQVGNQKGATSLNMITGFIKER